MSGPAILSQGRAVPSEKERFRGLIFQGRLKPMLDERIGLFSSSQLSGIFPSLYEARRWHLNFFDLDKSTERFRS